MEALSYEDICDGIKIATASSISQTRPDFSHSLLSISVLFLSLREKVLMDFDIRTSFRRLKWSRGEDRGSNRSWTGVMSGFPSCRRSGPGQLPLLPCYRAAKRKIEDLKAARNTAGILMLGA